MNGNRRNKFFDLNREIEENNNNMAEVQKIQNLQAAMQQMQEQYQREIAALRQQIGQAQQAPQLPARNFQLSADQILKSFSDIKAFYGKEDYLLQKFISAVENAGALCGNYANILQHGLQIIFTEKIQAEARRCIQRLGANLTWEDVKTELKIQFKPRRSYKKLMDESCNIKVNNLRELFNIIRTINFQLNELYEYDDNKPSNYSPENNDKNLVDIVKDMLVGSFRINIRNDMTLNEVFNIFDDLCLLDESDVIHCNFRKNNRDSRHNNVHRREIRREDDRNALYILFLKRNNIFSTTSIDYKFRIK